MGREAPETTAGDVSLEESPVRRRSIFPGRGSAAIHEPVDLIVAEGLAANPLPKRKPGKRGRLKKGKIRCLLERFDDCKADILRFATDWYVPIPTMPRNRLSGLRESRNRCPDAPGPKRMPNILRVC